MRSTLIADIDGPTEAELLAFIEGTLDASREEDIRHVLGGVPGALERAEAMRRDRNTLQCAVTATPESVQAPAHASSAAIESALGTQSHRGARKNSRRWMPALAGIGALTAAAIGWVVIIEGGLLERKPDDPNRYVISTESAPAPPDGATLAVPDPEVGAFINTPVAGTFGAVKPTVEPAEEPVPNHQWAAVDEWGYARQIDSSEATDWLIDRRLVVIIRVPDTRGTDDQMRLLSVLPTVRMVLAEPPELVGNDAPDSPGQARTTQHAGSHTQQRLVLHGVLDPGSARKGETTISHDRVIRMLDEWLVSLPVLAEASMHLFQLDETERMPDVPEEDRDTMFARQKSLLIRIVEENALPGGSGTIEAADRPTPWIAAPAPGALQP